MKQLIKELAELLRELWARFKFWSKSGKQCFHCCLWCEYFDDCYAHAQFESVSVTHRGYTICQDGGNHHTMIFDSNGNVVYHAQVTQPLTEDELREQIDFYLDKKNMYAAVYQQKRVSLLKPYRKYDQIKDMSLDEMAEFLDEVINGDEFKECDYCEHCTNIKPFCNGVIGKDCIKAFKNFLESEAKKTDEN